MTRIWPRIAVGHQVRRRRQQLPRRVGRRGRPVALVPVLVVLTVLAVLVLIAPVEVGRLPLLLAEPMAEPRDGGYRRQMHCQVENGTERLVPGSRTYITRASTTASATKLYCLYWIS